MKKNKRVLIVLTEFPSISETFILNQIVDLVERGFSLTIFSYCRPSSQIIHPLYKKFELEAQTIYHFKNQTSVWKRFFYGFHFIYRHFFNISFLKLFRFLLNTSSSFPKRIRALYEFPMLVFRTDFDVVHAHFGFNGKKVADYIDYFSKKPKRFMVSFHGSDLTPSKIPEYKILYQGLLSKADFFTVNSTYLKDIFLQLKPKSGQLILLPESIRSEEMRPYLTPKKFEGVLEIVYCGRLVGWKGPDRAVLIVENLVKRGYSNVQLHLIGGGELFDEIEVYIKNHQLQSHVFLYGPLRQDYVFEIFSKSHLFLLPGIPDSKTQRAEAQGLVIQEAQFFKLPVVVSDTGGSKYGFVNQKTGFLMPLESSIDDYADILIRFINNPAMITTMGDFGHNWVGIHFESTINGEKLEQLYES